MKKIILFFCVFLLPFISKANVLTVINTQDAGYGSLRAIIDSAQDGDTINFDSNLISFASDTISLLSDLKIYKGLVVKGLYNSSDTLFISGRGVNKVFNINLGLPSAKKSFVLDSVCVIDGKSNDYGAGVTCRSGDTLIILNSLIKNNHVDLIAGSNLFGGGVYSTSDLIIENSIIDNNKISGGGFCAGGGCYSKANLTIKKCDFTNNSVTSLFNNGGGASSDSLLNIEQSNFLNNKVTIANNSYGYNHGGGVYSKTLINVRKSNFYYNSTNTPDDSQNFGGAICSDSSVIIDSCIISFNSSYSGGVSSGGAVSSSDFIIIRNSTLDSNYAKDGGGIHMKSTTDSMSLKLINCIITNSSGGGISIVSIKGISLEISDCEISNCKSDINGGGLNVNALSTLSIDVVNSRIINNEAFRDGGGVYVYSLNGADLRFIGNTVTNNNALRSGGGVYMNNINDSLVIQMDNCKVFNNLGNENGAGIFCASSYLSIFMNDNELNNNILNTSTSHITNTYGAGLYCVSSYNSNININRSSIYNNATFSSGGAVTSGGGLYSRSNGNSILNISKSTIYNNQTNSYQESLGSAIYNSSSDSSVVNIKNSTIANNENFILPGGGVGNAKGVIYNIANTGNAKINFGSSIFFDNVFNRRNVTIQKDHFAWDATILSLGNNIFDNNQSGTISNDYLSVSAVQLKLDSVIRFNGGNTPTLLPGVGSLAINNGDPLDLTRAQNGLLVGRRDIGAAERNLIVMIKDSITACDSLFWIDGKTYYSDTVVSKTYIGGASNGFDSVITATIDIIKCYTDVKEIIPTLEMSVFPNPAENIININFNNYKYKNLTLQVYSISGKLILDKPITSGKSILDVSSFNEGMYFFKVSNSTINLTKKVIIM